MERRDLLREVMRETDTSQSELSRMSGVRQPSISQALSGRIEISDDQLNRLLCCMGFEVEIVRRPVRVGLTRSEQRSWELHRALSGRLNRTTVDSWRPTIDRNLQRLQHGVRGEPHGRNLRRWQQLINSSDLGGLHRILTGLDRDSIEMREVSPMGGVLSEHDRREILALSR